jgi:hypothetical protein
MMALRGLDALNDIWRNTLDVAGDQRWHLAAAIECRIASMIVKPKQFDQAATGMLRQLRAAGLAREATDCQSFRAFSLRL